MRVGRRGSLSERGRSARAVLASLAAHVLLMLGWVLLAPPRGVREERPVARAPDAAIEVEWLTRVPERSPGLERVYPRTPPEPLAREPRPAEPRVAIARSPHGEVPARAREPGPPSSDLERDPPSGSTLPEASNGTQSVGESAQPATPRISVSDLYENVDALSNAAAAQGAIDLGQPGRSPGRSRDLFGRPRGSIRDIALAPTREALQSSNHLQAAGTSRHDRIVARRAEEEFDPVHTVPNLGEHLRHAPTVRLPPARHTPSEGEVAVANELDARRATYGVGVIPTPMYTIPAPPYHLLRAEVEVDQDAEGNVLDARVVRSSGLASLDAAALRAIRQSLPLAPALRTGVGRRSRWSFEVSNAMGHNPVAVLMGGGDEGWRVLNSSSNGMPIRVRVRMMRASALGAPAGGEQPRP